MLFGLPSWGAAPKFAKFILFSVEDWLGATKTNHYIEGSISKIISSKYILDCIVPLKNSFQKIA